MIQRRELLLSDIVDQLTAGTPVVFSRWGDGEWSAILGKRGQNCDGHAYTAELQRDLTQVLEAKPEYYLGLQNAALRRYGPEIEAWLEARQLDLPWVPSDLWHQASMRDQLESFLEVLRAREVILVGPARLRSLDLPFPLAAFIEIPLVNCHTAADRVVDLTCMHAMLHPQAIIALSASMSANVIVHRVHRQYPTTTLLDLGSLWEPYVGVATRAYHHDVRKRLQVQR